MGHTYVIAEAGINHNGSKDLALRLIDSAVNSGADAVKFQTFKADKLVTKQAKKAEYQTNNTDEKSTQYEMLKQLELSTNDFKELKNYSDEMNITFMSTPFDNESVDFLIDELGLNTIKVSSGDLTNSPLLYYIAKRKVQIIISTGMAQLEDIYEALAFIAYGLSNQSIESINDVMKYYKTKEAKELLKKYVTVLHCTTAYPTPLNEVNLNSITYLKEKLGLPIGFSDHTEGITIPIAAVAKGATIIEKHFTLNRSLPGPDHQASLEPDELKNMVESIRQVDRALGHLDKKPTKAELANQAVARKSLVTAKKINSGECWTRDHIQIKRPGNGIPPKEYWNILGKKAFKNYEEDELICVKSLY